LSADNEPASIRFYFSFRSPYAWLAAERLEEEFGDLGVAIERIPIYPTAALFPNDPSAMPNKVAHLVQDVRRLTRERGLPLHFPQNSDTEWAAPHAAYLGAERLGRGHALMIEIFRKRFSEGLDVGQDQVIGDAAEKAGLDRTEAIEAAHAPELREEAAAGWERAIERDRVFGVPTFVYADKLYWGQDRMHFVRQAVLRKSGKAP
jgi:2-hydroxychromene-2-carboxylate isomerase